MLSSLRAIPLGEGRHVTGLVHLEFVKHSPRGTLGRRKASLGCMSPLCQVNLQLPQP